MPDQKISADPINTTPTTQAALAGIDHGLSTSTNYRFNSSSMQSWLGLNALSQNTVTASYTLVLADNGRVVEVNSASNLTVTVPPNSSVALPVGAVVEVYRMGTGTLTIAAGAGVTIRNPNASLTLRAQYSTATLRKRAADEWVLAGDMTS